MPGETKLGTWQKEKPKKDIETVDSDELECAAQMFDKVAAGKCQNCGFDFFCSCIFIG